MRALKITNSITRRDEKSIEKYLSEISRYELLTPEQETRYREFRRFIEQIPADASVTVTSRIGPHVSNRAEVWSYRDKKQTEYLMLDTRDMKGWPRKHHADRLAAGKVELLAKEGTLQLFRILK